ADARQVGPGALRAELEGMVVDALTRQRVVAVTFGLGAQRADHLRVTVVAALAQVDVASLERERWIRLHARRRPRHFVRQVQRHDFHQPAAGDHQHDPDAEPVDLPLDGLVAEFFFFVVRIHAGSGMALSAVRAPATVLYAL